MSTTDELAAKVREATQKGQEAVLTAAKTWSDTATHLLSEIDPSRAARYVPRARSAVNSAFDVAERAVSRQRDVVLAVLDTVEQRLADEGTGTEAKAGAEAAPADAGT